MAIRIGYGDPDRLVSYPDARFLSGCSLPIQVLLTDAGVCWYPGRAVPLRASGSSLTCRLIASLPTNLARNSLRAISDVEMMSLQFQRFLMMFKSDRVKLRARFVGKCMC